MAEFISVGSRAAMEITRPLTTRPMLELDRMGPGQTDGVSEKDSESGGSRMWVRVFAQLKRKGGAVQSDP